MQGRVLLAVGTPMAILTFSFGAVSEAVSCWQPPVTSPIMTRSVRRRVDIALGTGLLTFSPVLRVPFDPLLLAGSALVGP